MIAFLNELKIKGYELIGALACAEKVMLICSRHYKNFQLYSPLFKETQKQVEKQNPFLTAEAMKLLELFFSYNNEGYDEDFATEPDWSDFKALEKYFSVIFDLYFKNYYKLEQEYYQDTKGYSNEDFDIRKEVKEFSSHCKSYENPEDSKE